MPAHEAVCGSKPKKCPACDIELLEAEYESHVNTCLSKTDMCPICKKNIQYRDFELHFAMCQSALDSKQMEELKKPKKAASKKLYKESAKKGKSQMTDEEYARYTYY